VISIAPICLQLLHAYQAPFKKHRHAYWLVANHNCEEKLKGHTHASPGHVGPHQNYGLKPNAGFYGLIESEGKIQDLPKVLASYE
jgi:hypothetical protein